MSFCKQDMWKIFQPILQCNNNKTADLQHSFLFNLAELERDLAKLACVSNAILFLIH